MADKGAFVNPFDVIDGEENGEGFSMTVPQEVDQALKKISKKGSKTRERGFTELLEALKSVDSNELPQLALLLRSSFQMIFKKYVLAPEKSNRLAVAQFTKMLFEVADRKNFLQPILPEILTLWTMSLFDSISEVSTIHRKTFELIFPRDKQTVLFDRFGELVFRELLAYGSSEQLSSLREVTMKDFEGNDEECSQVTELVRTEITGALGFLSHKWSAFDKNEASQSCRFVMDKLSDIRLPRRMAFLKFVSAINSKFPEECSELFSIAKKLVSEESTLLGLLTSLDFIKQHRKEMSSVLGLRQFNDNVLSFLPVSEFAGYLQLLMEDCVNIDNVVQYYVALCNDNRMLSRERFLSFWNSLAKPTFKISPNRQEILKELVFSGISAKGLKSFKMLSVEDTLECIYSAFTADEIVAVCETEAAKSAPLERVLLLSKLDESSALQESLGAISIDDLLQRKELMTSIPNEIIIQKLKNNPPCSPSSVVRLLMGLETGVFLEVFQDLRLDFWPAVVNELKTKQDVNLARTCVKEKLFKIPEFIDAVVPDQFLIECAFESSESVYKDVDRLSSKMVDDSLGHCHLNEDSPLLRHLLKCHRYMDHCAVQEICQNTGLMCKLDLANDPELFLALRCNDESLFPISYIKDKCKTICPDSLNPTRLFLYESKTLNNDLILQRLLDFPCKSLENQKYLAVCAFLFNIKMHAKYEISCSEFLNIASALEAFALFRNSFITDVDVEFDCIDSFPKALAFHVHLASIDCQEVNALLNELIFPEDEALTVEEAEYIALTLSISPSLMVRSDNLSGLMECLAFNQRYEQLYLLASVHVGLQGSLKREFWQVQWQERLKLTIPEMELDSVLDELYNRFLAGVWNLLESPELDILPDHCESLLQLRDEESSSNMEQFGKARLLVLACPFLKENLSLEVLKGSLCRTQSKSWMLALRSCLIILHQDEELVRSQASLKASSSLEDVGPLIFPLYDLLQERSDFVKYLMVLEMFISWSEGAREDGQLQSLFAEVFQATAEDTFSFMLERLEGDGFAIEDSFAFEPREFEVSQLLGHVMYRLAANFPLIVGSWRESGLKLPVVALETLQKREFERIRRNPEFVIDSIRIGLKLLLTSTTRNILLSLNYGDEITLKIVLHIPAEFPLVPLQVEGQERSGLAESKWKSALLSLQTMLRAPTSFKGNVVEVVRKWQSNALGLFQGLQECSVCYCVVHPSDRSLPGPSCKQCKQRFHASCLYKWFKSSGNATCPLCRGLF